jgi:hypothetical protein
MSDATVEPERIERTGTVELTWDAPAPLSHYAVYYRAVGERDWRHLQNVEPSSNPRASATLPEGDYEFAVRWVSTDGRESELHRSTDQNAERPDGTVGPWTLAVRSSTVR